MSPVGQMVGERGPELAWLPPKTRIGPHGVVRALAVCCCVWAVWLP